MIIITILAISLIIYLFGLYYDLDLGEHRTNKLKQFINDEKYYEAAKYYIKKDFFLYKSDVEDISKKKFNKFIEALYIYLKTKATMKIKSENEIATVLNGRLIEVTNIIDESIKLNAKASDVKAFYGDKNLISVNNLTDMDVRRALLYLELVDNGIITNPKKRNFKKWM